MNSLLFSNSGLLHALLYCHRSLCLGAGDLFMIRVFVRETNNTIYDESECCCISENSGYLLWSLVSELASLCCVAMGVEPSDFAIIARLTPSAFIAMKRIGFDLNGKCQITSICCAWRTDGVRQGLRVHRGMHSNGFSSIVLAVVELTLGWFRQILANKNQVQCAIASSIRSSGWLIHWTGGQMARKHAESCLKPQNGQQSMFDFSYLFIIFAVRNVRCHSLTNGSSLSTPSIERLIIFVGMVGSPQDHNHWQSTSEKMNRANSNPFTEWPCRCEIIAASWIERIFELLIYVVDVIVLVDRSSHSANASKYNKNHNINYSVCFQFEFLVCQRSKRLTLGYGCDFRGFPQFLASICAANKIQDLCSFWIVSFGHKSSQSHAFTTQTIEAIISMCAAFDEMHTQRSHVFTHRTCCERSWAKLRPMQAATIG